MISDRADSREEKEMRVGGADGEGHRERERERVGATGDGRDGREESKREIKGDYLPMR